MTSSILVERRLIRRCFYADNKCVSLEELVVVSPERMVMSS